MANNLVPLPRFRYFDSNGDPLAGGKVFTYQAGTTTNKTTYTDSSTSTPNTNPVILDSEGYADIWFTGSLKLLIKTSADVTLSTTDNITNVDSALSTGNKVIGGDGLLVGDITSSGDGNIILGGRDLEISGTADNALAAVGNNNVVSADYAAAVAGQNNAASNTGGVVVGGQSHTNSGQYSAIVAGDGASLYSNFSAIVAGVSNINSGANAVVLGGSTNEASATNSSVLAGANNNASGTRSVICGGTTNTNAAADALVTGSSNTATVDAPFAMVSGAQASATHYAERAHAAGRFSANGDCQEIKVVMRNTTTNATPTELFLNGSTLRLTIPTNTRWTFLVIATAHQTSGGAEGAHYVLAGGIKNLAGTTALQGAVTVVHSTETTGSMDFTATADNTNDALALTATGIAATTIRWAATVTLTQISG